MSEQHDNSSSNDPNDDYIGNMWGWKFSWISLGLILFTMMLLKMRRKKICLKFKTRI